MLSLGGNGTMSQEWDMTPATDVDALMRLRTLYLYVAGQMVEKSGEDLEHEFLCNYPVQRHPVTQLDDGATDKNIAYRVPCKVKPGSMPEPVVYLVLIQSFVSLPNCIVCITSDDFSAWKTRVDAAAAIKAKKAEPGSFPYYELKINPRLQHAIVFCANSLLVKCGKNGRPPTSNDIDLSHQLTTGQSQRQVIPELPQIGLQLNTQVYLQGDSEKEFRDFILFTFAAMAPGHAAGSSKERD